MKKIFQLIIFVKPYWKKSLVALILLTSVVFMDLTIPRLIQRIIDQGIARNNLSVVIQTTLWMLGIALISTIFAIGNNSLSVQVGEGVARDLRDALFLKIQTFSYGNLDRMNTGLLMVRLSSDASVFQRLVQVTLRIGTRAPLLMIGSLILMFNTDRRLAIMMLPLLFIISVIIGVFLVKMGPLFLSVQHRLDRLNTVLQENIAGVRVVKAFVRADRESQRFGEANEEYTQYNIRVMQFMTTLGPVLNICLSIGIVLVIWLGGLQSIRGELSIGQIVAFVNYLQTTVGPLTLMVMLANVWAAGTASSERIVEVLQTVPEVQDPTDAQALPDTKLNRIEFEEVGFHYNRASTESVLDGVNLAAESGEMVAILGATGSGKTTLVSLIPRFYDVSAGRLLINGIDVRQIEQDTLLKRIGIVPQETVLFSGSVSDNIRYGRPDASDSEVIAAAQAAQAHDFILKLPEGYQTHIEERGVNLSGGQKQRIAIARALLTQPDVLIMDDSTSSVDVETEIEIQTALEGWMQDRISFVVAQRISTVLNADKIVVLEEGRIVAVGNHQELLQTSRIYQEIYDSQLGDGPNLDMALPALEEGGQPHE